MGKKSITCYCEIPDAELERLAYRRIIERLPLQGSAGQAVPEREKRYLLAIELYGKNREEIAVYIEDPYFFRHFLDCRERVSNILQSYAGVPFPWESPRSEYSEAE